MQEEYFAFTFPLDKIGRPRPMRRTGIVTVFLCIIFGQCLYHLPTFVGHHKRIYHAPVK